jgi:hypothetical protein
VTDERVKEKTADWTAYKRCLEQSQNLQTALETMRSLHHFLTALKSCASSDAITQSSLLCDLDRWSTEEPLKGLEVVAKKRAVIAELKQTLSADTVTRLASGLDARVRHYFLKVIA